MKLEIGRIHVTRSGLKAVVTHELDLKPSWWRIMDERGFHWLARADGSALSDKNEHPLDLVERTNLTMRNADLSKKRGPAPEWK
jgi:hypothetical protein